MTRRGLFALVAAVLAARKLPAAIPQLTEVERLPLAHCFARDQTEMQRRYNHLLSSQIELTGYPKFKLGDTITIQRPVRFQT